MLKRILSVFVAISILMGSLPVLATEAGFLEELPLSEIPTFLESEDSKRKYAENGEINPMPPEPEPDFPHEPPTDETDPPELPLPAPAKVEISPFAL